MQIWTFCAPVSQPEQRTALPEFGVPAIPGAGSFLGGLGA